MTRILDGTGHGNVAKVDNTNRLWTAAIAEREISSASKNGDAYLFPCAAVYTLVADTETPFVRLQNNKTGYAFSINKMMVAWNGGTTSHNRPLLGKMYGDMSVPTANFALAAGGNMNQSSAKTSDMDQHVWNTVGSGMTVASNGSLLNALYATQGYLVVDLEGSVIMGPGDVLGFTLEAEETGKGYAAISGWFVEI